jgi:DNA-binding response OmpR family regulator
MLEVCPTTMPKAKILIVDDDQDIRRLLAHRLKNEGYEAVFAGDAIAAVNVARKEAPDLILLDLGLPAGDGRLVMERLRVMPALEGIPIIVITARDVSLERDSLLAAGASAVFQKPFDYEVLVASVRSQLGEAGA